MKVCLNYKNKKVSKNIVTIGKKWQSIRRVFGDLKKKMFFDKLEVKLGSARKLDFRIFGLVVSSSFRARFRFLRRFARTHLIGA